MFVSVLKGSVFFLTGTAACYALASGMAHALDYELARTTCVGYVNNGLQSDLGACIEALILEWSN